MPDPSGNLEEPIDVVVTLNEINDQHGTGPLVKRVLKGRPWAKSIRSGAPVDERFEKAFQGYDSTAISHLVQARLPVQETTPHEPSLS